MMSSAIHTPNAASADSSVDRRGRLGGWSRAISGIALSVLAFEAVFRFLSFEVTRVDPVSHRQVLTMTHRLGEGFGVSHWDASGIRQSPANCTSCPRVLVLGDSFTEALQVNDPDAYPAVAEALLSSTQPILLVNAGQASRSPADYVFDALRNRQLVQPAWTVIQLNLDDLGPDAFIDAKIHFLEQGTKLLTPVAPPSHVYGRITRLLGVLRGHSALVNYALYRLDVIRQTRRPPRWFIAGSEPDGRPAPEARKYPVERELDLMRASYENRITFLFLPPFNTAIESGETRFERYCLSTPGSCVNLRASFDGFRQRGTAPYGFPNSRFGEGHLNRDGHAAARATSGRRASEAATTWSFLAFDSLYS